VPGRGQSEKRIAARRLDLYDACAGLAKSRDGERTGKVLRDRDDSDSFEEVRRIHRWSVRFQIVIRVILVNIEVQVLFLTRRRGGHRDAEDFAIGVVLCTIPFTSRSYFVNMGTAQVG